MTPNGQWTSEVNCQLKSQKVFVNTLPFLSHGTQVELEENWNFAKKINNLKTGNFKSG